ncbi:CXL10 protein, partial [Polyodon spathula]|nr:CXL10 protein [Polyodon spathula]
CSSGTSLYGKGRCICLKNGDDFVRGRNIVKLEVIPKSPMCDRLEIIVTMKGTAEQRCLNPQSKFVQNLVSTLRTRYTILKYDIYKKNGYICYLCQFYKIYIVHCEVFTEICKYQMHLL